MRSGNIQHHLHQHKQLFCEVFERVYTHTFTDSRHPFINDGRKCNKEEEEVKRTSRMIKHPPTNSSM